MRKIWLICAPGIALPGIEVGRAWLPWMRKVEFRDFDGVTRTTSTWPSNLCDRN